jgi:hypothetical protein
MPGAQRENSSCPKYDCPAPAATIRLSYGSSNWTRAQRGDRAPIEVESRHARQRHLGVLLAAKHAADRRRDLPLRQDPRGHLVQQRLEQVVIDAVDEGEIHGRALQEPGSEQPAESAPDDDDAMPH